MLVFIVPLKSARTSRSWHTVSSLFERTVASACAQTSQEFRVVAVCHEFPEIKFDHPNLKYVQADFPSPSRDAAEMKDDKRRKHFIGLNQARNYSPSHVMLLDADDMVSNRLAEFVASHSQENGWFIRSGYFLCDNQDLLYREPRRFYRWCGSSQIIRTDLMECLESSDGRLGFNHIRLPEILRKLGTPSRPLPFPGAIYTVSHGDNFYDYEATLWPSNPVRRAVRRVLSHRAVTPAIRDEFGVCFLPQHD